MATCKISEYLNLGVDANGYRLPFPQEPPLTTQTITFTTSAQSAALNAETRFIRLIADAKAHFRISAAGTNATVASPFLAANVPEYFAVQKGQAMIVDVYDGSS